MEENKELILKEDISIPGTEGNKTISLEKDNKILIRAAKNILSRKAETISTKKQETQDIESINESDLDNVLAKEDVVFYQAKKELYMSAYPELTDPFDLDDIHYLIMEQIFQRNLFKSKKKHPSIDITDSYERSLKRLDNIKKSLSMRRTDRLKNKGDKKQTLNISNLSLNFNSKEGIERMEKRLLDMKNQQEALVIDSDRIVE